MARMHEKAGLGVYCSSTTRIFDWLAVGKTGVGDRSRVP